MPRLSLTDFIDIVSRAGTSRTTKVAQLKKRPPYDPAFDFYKIVRDAIEATHQQGHPKSHLGTVLGKLQDPKKQVNYPAIVSGYSRWWGRKSISWFVPPSALFSHAGVEVSVNPELGLEFGGEKHIIKLYFKGAKLTKQRTMIVTGLMEHSLRAISPPGAKMALLDIRSSKLFPAPAMTPNLIAGLQAELAYIATLWPLV